MEWFQVLVIIISVFGLFLYLASKIDAWQRSIYDEMKDFHARLYALEERYKDKN